VFQWSCISFQIGVAKYNTIYGGFAALPLFLIWIELSWLIVLLGAEISFAYQNAHTYEFEPDCKGVSLAFKRLLALVIVHLIIKRFQQGDEPVTAADIVETQGTPIRLVNQILEELVACGVVIEIRQKDERIVGYQPARSVDAITIHYVVHALEQQGNNTMPIARTAGFEDIAKRLESFRAQLEGSPENVCLKDI
jgi:membrane protein